MIDWRVVRRRLLFAVAIVAALGLVVELAHVEALIPTLSLSYEANLPTWFSSSLLLACSVAAGAVAMQAPAWRKHWWFMCGLAAYMSLDEAAEIHEHLGGLVGTHGVLYFDWVIPAAGALVVLTALYLPFMRALPRVTRNRLVLAAVIYIGGAVGMELPLGWWTERHGNDGLGYALIDWVEETLEMIGAAIALLSLLAHRKGRR